MALIDHGFPEKFLLFVQNFIMTLEVLGVLTFNEKLQYLHTPLCVEVLHQFDTLCSRLESMIISHLNWVILDLGSYFYPVNLLYKQECAMICGMRNTCELKVRPYAACMIDINDYLDAFPGGKASDNIGEIELSEIILISMPNRRSKQAYVQCFDCEKFTIKKLLTHLNIWKLREIFMKVL